jgi:putative peptide zinc metalloprotease protein
MMSVTTDTLPAGVEAPQLVDGTELIGKSEGSGLIDPPYLIRRRDGQVVQLSRLLYTIAAAMDGRSLEAIAQRAGVALDVRITPEQISHVAAHKLAPLGLVRSPDGSEPTLQPVDALLALRYRAGILPGRHVDALARLLQPLFLPPIVLAALVTVAAFDVWLVTAHGIGAGLQQVIRTPSLALALFAVVPVSLFFHELGHAAACRYGGARPGRIGIGIYLIWPVFFTDVTDSYRLGRRGRLRTDLGGVYFNVLFALTGAGAYLATGFEPLLLVVVSQQMLILDQFIPWVRLDGYHIVSDLIGVSDLFARIKPVLWSLVPGRRPDPRVAALKPWARAAVTIWVLTTVAVLSVGAAVIVLQAPRYLRHAWDSLLVQGAGIGHGMRVGSVVEVLMGGIGTVMLVLPVVGITLTYLMLCRRMGSAVAIRHARTHPTLAAVAGEKAPHPTASNVPPTPATRRA